VRYRGGGGRGIGGRGAGCRRTWCSPTGRHWVEEAGALAGEAMGGRGRVAHQWWGGARRSRKQCSPMGEVWGDRAVRGRTGGTGSDG
jgi:hypothetical protein